MSARAVDAGPWLLRHGLLLVLALALALRLALPLGADGFSVSEIQLQLLANELRLDPSWWRYYLGSHHGPLTPLILKAATAVSPFFSSETGARSISVTISLLVVLLTQRICRPVLGPSGALFAAAFIAVNPLFLALSLSARLYPLTGLLVLLAVHLARVLLARQAAGRPVLPAAGALSLVCALSLVNHLIAAPCLGGIALFVLVFGPRPWGARLPALAALAVGLLLALPWSLFELVNSSSDVDFPLLDLGWLLGMLMDLSNGPFLPLALLALGALWLVRRLTRGPTDRGAATPDRDVRALARLTGLVILSHLLAIASFSLLVFSMSPSKFYSPVLPLAGIWLACLGWSRGATCRRVLLLGALVLPLILQLGLLVLRGERLDMANEVRDIRAPTLAARKVDRHGLAIALPAYMGDNAQIYWPRVRFLQPTELAADDARGSIARATVLIWTERCQLPGARDACASGRRRILDHGDRRLVYRDRGAEVWSPVIPETR